MDDSIKGLRELLKNLDRIKGDLGDKIDAVIQDNSLGIEQSAKTTVRNTAFDNGNLAQSIKAIRIGPRDWKVEANATGLAPYAPYIEFGTGGLVNVPSELSEVAIRFKGKGVKQINLRPRPYLYPALVKQRELFVRDLVKLLNKELDV